MNKSWSDPAFAKAYAENVDHADWYEYEVNVPSLLSLIPAGAQSVLDFGCGPGQFTAKLADKYKMTGADSSPEMVQLASKAYPTIPFCVWDGQSAYPTGQTFDVVFSKLTLHFLEDLATFAHHVRAVLRDGGCLVVSVPHPVRVLPKVGGVYSATTIYDSTIGDYGLNVQMIHRSFEQYVTPFVTNGFALTGLLEPIVSRVQAEQHGVTEEDTRVPKRLNLRFVRTV